MAKIVRLTESDLTRLVKRVIKEQELGKKLMTENMQSNFSMDIDKMVKDPRVKKVLNGILQCAFATPTKAFDYLRAVTNIFGLIFGEPSQSSEASFERYNSDRLDSIKELKALINPCNAVTVEEIMSTINHPELKSYISHWKNKLSEY